MTSQKKANRKAEVAALNAAALDGSLPDDRNPIFLFGMTHTEILMAIATGKIDAVQLAKEQLAGRGIGQDGKWVGFDCAETEWSL